MVLVIVIFDVSYVKGVSVVVMIYYLELKVYGYNCVYVINVFVEFNVEIFSLIYKLLIGVFGWSNVFDILCCLGLSENIIIEVRSFVDIESVDLNDMIFSLEEKWNLVEIEYEEVCELVCGVGNFLKDL